MVWEKFPSHSGSHGRPAPCQVDRALPTVDHPQEQKSAKLMTSVHP